MASSRSYKHYLAVKQNLIINHKNASWQLIVMES